MAIQLIAACLDFRRLKLYLLIIADFMLQIRKIPYDYAQVHGQLIVAH